ncbi:COG4280 domain-containing protein [Bosea sp. 2YAB26]|uniref:COG4280 domain-containing protein n=1 Tax=Bosea sp. 2YAB26 TaxID=3237478 RepID=UPI003F8DB6E9
MISWATAAPAISATFLASLVEVVEAFTIVLAVATVQGWRPALTGTVAGLGVLGLLVLALGPVIDRIPLQGLQLVIGVLLLLFGLRWLRKAILRAAGIIALHDEELAFARETASLTEAARRDATQRNWIAGLAAFKAVVLEGVEVVFIVIAVGAGRGLLWPAALGAVAACLLVLIIGFTVHKPLSRVPENTLKFGVGVMLSAFGVYWTGEGLGVAWPGHDLAIPALAAVFVAVGLSLVPVARRPRTIEPQEIEPQEIAR